MTDLLTAVSFNADAQRLSRMLQCISTCYKLTVSALSCTNQSMRFQLEGAALIEGGLEE